MGKDAQESNSNIGFRTQKLLSQSFHRTGGENPVIKLTESELVENSVSSSTMDEEEPFESGSR